MKSKIRIALVEDEALFRGGISFLLQQENNIEIIYEADNGSKLLAFLKNTTVYPDIVLMDLKMPVLNGVETTKIIHSDYPDIKIIALTSYNTKFFIANMIRIGAASYLMKNTTPKELLQTINEVADKGFYYNDSVFKIIGESLNQSRKVTRSRFDDDELTSREIEVLQLICQQFSGNEIAEKLCISYRTVEGHRNNLLRKLDCKNAAGLVVYAIQNEIVPLESLLQ